MSASQTTYKIGNSTYIFDHNHLKHTFNTIAVMSDKEFVENIDTVMNFAIRASFFSNKKNADIMNPKGIIRRLSDIQYQSSTLESDVKKTRELFEEEFEIIPEKFNLHTNYEQMNQDKKIEMVKEFNKAFGITMSKKPTLISQEEYELRFKLMAEELTEYKEACVEQDIVEVADAIVDLMYVLNGMVIAHGLQDVVFDMFEEVHKSNMSKLENGKVLRRHDGKVLKGSEYFTPNLNQFLDA
jgi:predicted HAD superfamily Cof-like phosphohydrolase